MARRKAAAKRVVLPDPLFKDDNVAKFMNVVMRSGKKTVAEKIVYGALDELAQRGKVTEEAEKVTGSILVSATARERALEVFNNGLEAVKPTVEVKSRRVGGATYQVPIEVRPERRTALAMRWLTMAATARNEKTMALRLAHEIMDAIEGKGGALKKREDMHRMAKANQAFAHYRW